MPLPTGASVTILSQSPTPNGGYGLFLISGTYTAEDFEFDTSDGLGFSPVKAVVLNLTERNETMGLKGNDDGLKTVAAGTRTLAAHGITFGDRKLGIDVSVAGPITNNAAVLLEVWG